MGLCERRGSVLSTLPIELNAMVAEGQECGRQLPVAIPGVSDGRLQAALSQNLALKLEKVKQEWHSRAGKKWTLVLEMIISLCGLKVTFRQPLPSHVCTSP